MYRTVFSLLISLMICACSGPKSDSLRLPYYNEPDFTPIFIEASQAKEKINHTIADFAFFNQDSLIVDQSVIEGKIHVADFIFTICGSICPVMTDHMKWVSDSLRNNNEVVFLSFSVTPWIDRPHVLKDYAKKNEIYNPNWHFLTGDKAAIYTLARQSYFAEEDIGFSKDSTEFLHTEHFVLVDKSKRIRGIYNGTLMLEMMQLKKDIETLSEED